MQGLFDKTEKPWAVNIWEKGRYYCIRTCSFSDSALGFLFWPLLKTLLSQVDLRLYHSGHS